MSYDFDTIKDRSGTYSIKWNISDGELPMWVADMDFETAPEIKQAIVERAGQAAGVVVLLLLHDDDHEETLNLDGSERVLYVKEQKEAEDIVSFVRTVSSYETGIADNASYI